MRETRAGLARPTMHSGGGPSDPGSQATLAKPMATPSYSFLGRCAGFFCLLSFVFCLLSFVFSLFFYFFSILFGGHGLRR